MSSKYIHFFLRIISVVCFWVISLGLSAQSVPGGFSYQASLINQDGQLMKNEDLQLRISLTGPLPVKKTYFVENHFVRTSDQGIFSIVIGQGDGQQDIVNRVPWAEENVWLNIELLNDNEYKLVSQGALLAVPYAFHAETANRLVTTEEESNLRTDQSITWNTSGNFKTVPDVHFLGTVDEKALYFKTSDTTRMVISAEGQTTFYTDPDITGKDDDINSYPMIINGGRQGIYIQIEEKRDNTNNYMTFADPFGIHGAVEGQTVAEFFQSFEFKHFIAVNTADVVLGGVNGAFGAIEAAGITAAGKPDAALAGKGEILKGIFEEIRFKLFRITKFITQHVVNIGVYYKSGSADYAEWLERAPEELPMRPGEVVGLSQGKISRQTEHADHLLVISKSPLVLGNMPQQEEQEKFEKVAMKGQVEVWCVGQVNIGDYILPSGNNDGMAIAVSPNQMQTGDYSRIVGIAWEASNDAPINRVNVAIGINQNDLTKEINKLNDQVQKVKAYLKGQISIDGLESASTENMQEITRGASFQKSTLAPQLSNEKYDEAIDRYADNYKYVFNEVNQQLKNEGINVETLPYLKSMFEDPIAYLKALRRDPNMKTYMGYFDQLILQAEN